MKTAKKILSMLLAVLMIVSIIPMTSIKTNALISDDFEYEIYSEEKKTCEITGYNGSATELEIPLKIEEYIVVGISYGAFEGCTELIEVVIPNSVKWIADYAFRGCSSLKVINLPESIEDLENTSFEKCSNLSDITVSNDNPAYCSEEGVLFNKDKTELICYPDGKEISNYEIPNSVETLSDYAFNDCINLISITFNENIKTISFRAFENCNKLKNVKNMNGIETIDSYSFADCESLTDIVLPESLMHIENNAFYNCRSLNIISIPESVITIDSQAFENTAYYDDENNWENGVLYIDDCLIGTDAFDVSGEYIIKDGTRLIASRGFINCTDLISVEIPDTVISLGESAFWGCSNLTNVEFSDNIVGIGSYTFNDCISLTSINIPESVEYVESWAFCDCINLTNISLPDRAIDIYYEAFFKTAYYDNEENWKDGVLYIGNHLIKADADVVKGDFAIDDGIKSIAAQAFQGCTELTTVLISDSVEVVGVGAFESCINLTDLLIGNGVKSIEHFAFSECRNLKEVIIPDSVETIGEHAFSYCDSLKSVVLSDNLKKLGMWGFARCRDLKGITIPDGVTNIEWGTFLSCTDLKYIVLPKGINSIEEYAFKDCVDLNHIFYKGTEEEWNGIEICFDKNDASSLIECSTIHYDVSFNDAVEIYETEATCTEGGYTTAKCVICNENLYNEFSSYATGHIKGEVVEIIEPTCTEEGYTKYRCLTCGEEYYDDWTYVEHSYDILVESKEATCVERGYSKYQCATCDDTIFTYTENALGHTFENDVCSNCGMEKSDCIESLHPYLDDTNESWTINKPNAKSIAITFSSDTLIENGYDFIKIYDAEGTLLGTYTGDELASKEIVVLGDSVTIELLSDSSVNEYGFAISKVQTDVLRTVEADNIVVTEGNIGDLPHNVRLNIINVETTNSAIVYDISLLQGDVVIQPKNAVTVKIPVPDTMNGNEVKVYRAEDDGTYTDMNAVYEDNYMVFTTEHFGRYIITIDKLDSCKHSNGAWKIIAYPNCTMNGEKIFICSICGETYETVIIPATGHTFGEWVVTTEPTIKEDGTETRTCSLCGVTETRVIDKLEKTLGDLNNDGVRNSKDTGLLKYDGTWYYVNNGIFDFDYTGLVKHTNGVWYYVENGILDWSYSGLWKHNGTWYYVQKGQINWKYNGLVKHTNGTWYYVQGAKLNWNYTGLVKHTTGSWYYVQKGQINFSKTGLVKHTNGIWYYVQNGKLNWNKTGLVKHTDGNWYYVQKGQINWNYTGLVKHTNGKWYYVQKGKLNWNYTGYAYYNGKKYKVVKGEKV